MSAKQYVLCKKCKAYDKKNNIPMVKHESGFAHYDNLSGIIHDLKNWLLLQIPARQWS